MLLALECIMPAAQKINDRRSNKKAYLGKKFYDRLKVRDTDSQSHYRLNNYLI